jgi:hypothetical protein
VIDALVRIADDVRRDAGGLRRGIDQLEGDTDCAGRDGELDRLANEVRGLAACICNEADVPGGLSLSPRPDADRLRRTTAEIQRVADELERVADAPIRSADELRRVACLPPRDGELPRAADAVLRITSELCEAVVARIRVAAALAGTSMWYRRTCSISLSVLGRGGGRRTGPKRLRSAGRC